MKNVEDFCLFMGGKVNNYDGILADWYYMGVLEILESRANQNSISREELAVCRAVTKIFFCKLLEIIPENRLVKKKQPEERFLIKATDAIVELNRSLEPNIKKAIDQFLATHETKELTWA